MGQRKIGIKESAADSIAAIAYFIESKGLIKTAEEFSDQSYDFIEKLADSQLIHALCRDPTRAEFGFKCVTFKRKYTIVFLETPNEILICEFLPSKMIHW